MLEINKKSDIIIPFEKIGEDGWEIKTREIIESIAENFDDDLKDPLSNEEIEALESKLGTTLPEGLKRFYQTFGVADIGEELLGPDEIGWVKEVFGENAEYGPDFSDQDKEYLPYLITFSNYLGNGNLFCFHKETKEIYYFDHESRPYISRLFSSVDDYLRGCLIFAQVDFSDEDIEGWLEEIVLDYVGNDVVRKWRY